MSSEGFNSATRISAGVALTAEEIAESGVAAEEAIARYALRLGDDSLILSQRMAWWVSRAPELEEDIALGNIALDLLGHARVLLTYAGTAWDKSEDDLAYFRDEEEFTSCHLVEFDNGDFGRTIARQLVFSSYAYELYSKLVESTDETLAAVAAKAVKEVEYHLDHAYQWTLRLGIGTEESKRRVQRGFNFIWPYIHELFEDDELFDELPEGVAPKPSSLEEAAMGRVLATLEEAELEVPKAKNATCGGRFGEHREAMGYLLAEMQVLARKHPGAKW